MLHAKKRHATCKLLMVTMFIACTDAPIASPPTFQNGSQQDLRSSSPFELREGAEFSVRVTSHITIREKGKDQKKYKHGKTVRAKVRNGKAFAVDRGGLGKGSALLALQDEIISEDGTIASHQLNFTPLLAVTDG